MAPRSSVRTNIVIFTVLGFVVALLIHFIVLSSTRYNWLDNLAPNGTPGTPDRGALMVDYTPSLM